MITERHEELAALHALGLLEGAERDAFERKMAGDGALKSLVDSLFETTARLALTAPPANPPVALRAHVLEAATASTAASGTRLPRLVPFIRWLPPVMAAGLVITALWLGIRNSELQRDNADLRQQVGEQRDLSQLKITALTALAGNTPEARAIAVWDPAQKTGLLTVERLPAISEEQDYQIWVVDPAYPNPVDGGVFKPGSDGRVILAFKGHQPVGAVAAFAISLEKKGGVSKAEGPIVLLGKF